MLRPEYLEALPEEMVKLYRQVEDDILADMARRISTYDYYIPSAEHQRQKLREMGMLQSDILKTLSEKTGRTEELLKSMTLKAVTDSLTYDQKIYMSAGLVDKGAAIVTDGIKSVVNSGYAMTAGLFKNITRTTANTATKQFENALDRAWLQVRSGAFDYNTAIRRAVKDLSAQGIQSIRYPSGHVDTLEVAVRRAVLTGVNQSTLKAQWAKADEVGCDLVEVSAHAGARPTHAVWQGGIYSRSGESDKYPDFISSTDYGEGDGLGGWNCRHNFRPYIDGQPRTYSPELLSSYEAKDISYNGKKYTEYEASQIQRHIERNIRRWKRENVAMAAAGEDTAQSAAKISQWQATMRDFIDQTGFKRQSAREQIPEKGTDMNTQKQLVKLSRQYVNHDDTLYKNLQKVKPIKGFEDFSVHGAGNVVQYITTNGVETNYSPEEFADIIRNDPSYRGGNIRLLSCGVGSGMTGFAQRFADAIGATVLAPTEDLWIDDFGGLFVSNNDILAEMWYNGDKVKETGKWKKFFPQR